MKFSIMLVYTRVEPRSQISSPNVDTPIIIYILLYSFIVGLIRWTYLLAFKRWAFGDTAILDGCWCTRPAQAGSLFSRGGDDCICLANFHSHGRYCLCTANSEMVNSTEEFPGWFLIDTGKLNHSVFEGLWLNKQIKSKFSMPKIRSIWCYPAFFLTAWN